MVNYNIQEAGRITTIVAQADHTADAFMVPRAKCVVSELCAKKLGVYDVKLQNLSFAAVPYK